jgi:hypothetical protein
MVVVENEYKWFILLSIKFKKQIGDVYMKKILSVINVFILLLFMFIVIGCSP